MPPKKNAQDDRMEVSSLAVVHSGWVLKKKRKKMQGKFHSLRSGKMKWRRSISAQSDKVWTLDGI